MKNWIFLSAAIIYEVIATSSLKSSEGFTKLAPSLLVVAGYGAAFLSAFTHSQINSCWNGICNLVRAWNVSLF